MSQETRKFVVQQHTTAAGIHWDLMLESGDHLQTWRLDKNPAEVETLYVKAVKIFDHHLKFLTYEGTVNEGKGKVEIADAGTYQTLHADSENLHLQINGRILKGKFKMTCIKDDKCQFSKNRQ